MIKVDTSVMSSQEEQLRRIANQLQITGNSIKKINNSLDWNVCVNAKVRRSVSSSATNVVQMASKANNLANALQSISSSYTQTEKGNYSTGKGKTQKSSKSSAKSSKSDFKLWEWKDTWKMVEKFGIIGSVVAIVGGVATGGKPNIKTALDAASGVTKLVEKVAKAIPTNGASFDWKKLVGFDNKITPDTPENVWDNIGTEVEKLDVGKAKDVPGKVATYAKWAGYALTGITTTYENFTDTKEHNSTGRKIAESIGETAVKIGEGLLIGAAVTTACAAAGVAAPAVLVGGATVMVTWGIDKGVEAITGKNTAEFVSDTVLDSAVNIGKGAKQLWSSVKCGWASMGWHTCYSDGGGGSW